MYYYNKNNKHIIDKLFEVRFLNYISLTYKFDCKASFTLHGFDRTVKYDSCTVPMLSILLYRFGFIRTLKSRVVIMNDKQIIALWLYNRRRKRQQKNCIF